MRLLSLSLRAALACAALGAAQPAAAYPIDCAILLCLAGGFPPSAECALAKATMIRRITPWPITPPLQLWNCPMGMSADVAAAIGMSAVALGPDGLTPDVRAYRDGIEIYDITYTHRNTHDGETIAESVRKGVYRTDGTFEWVRGSFISGPAWLGPAVGGQSQPITQCTNWGGGDGGNCHAYQIVGYQNVKASSFRAIAIRTKDYEGKYTVEVVNY